MTKNRAAAAFEEVVAVEEHAPDMARVVTVSDCYVVDVRGGTCECPDFQYNLERAECKHLFAARDAIGDLGIGVISPDASLDERPQLATDGGQVGTWTVRDPESGNEREFDSRGAAEDAVDEMESLGVDVELVAPGEESDDDPDGEPDVIDVEATQPDADPVPEDDAPDTLGERSVAEDPLNWVPGEFVDTIDGTQAINRKGFEVLSHFYDISVSTDLQVPPEETDHSYCRVKAVATTPEGRECEAFGSAHVDRGDDAHLLLEMADTRARKRALSIATGVGAVAVAELKSEVQR